MVDGYGNIYAPLLPLLIPKLGLSLAAAGTLTACFQLAASVAQIGFGRLADRWRPRLLVMAGPVLSVSVLSFIGVATTPVMLALVLIVGGLGAAAFHPPAAALAHRLGGARPGFSMSVYITGGTLGFSLGPLMFAPFAQHFGLAWTPLLALPGLVVVAFFLTRVPPMPLHPSASGGFRTLRPYARPLGLLYVIVVLRTLTAISFATFLPAMLVQRGLSVSQAGTDVAIYLFASGLGGFIGGPAADKFGAKRVIALSLVMATPFLFVGATPERLALRHRPRVRRILSAVDAAGERHVRPGAGAGQRGHGVVDHDGIRLGHRRTQRAVCRRDCRPRGNRGDVIGAGARANRRGRLRAGAPLARQSGGACSRRRARGRRSRPLKPLWYDRPEACRCPATPLPLR